MSKKTYSEKDKDRRKDIIVAIITAAAVIIAAVIGISSGWIGQIITAFSSTPVQAVINTADDQKDRWKIGDWAGPYGQSIEVVDDSVLLNVDFTPPPAANKEVKAVFIYTLPPGLVDWSAAARLEFDAVFEPGKNSQGDLKATINVQTDQCWNEHRDYQNILPAKPHLSFAMDQKLFKTCNSKDASYDEALFEADRVTELHIIVVPAASGSTPAGKLRVGPVTLTTLKPKAK